MKEIPRIVHMNVVENGLTAFSFYIFAFIGAICLTLMKKKEKLSLNFISCKWKKIFNRCE